MKRIVLICLAMLLGWACKKDTPTPKKAFADITYSDIKSLEAKFSSNMLMIGKSDGTGPQVGAIIFYKSQNGVFGKMKIIKIDSNSWDDLTIDMINYSANGSAVILNKSGVLVQSSYSLDLDNGVQTTNDALMDFGWNQEGLNDGHSFQSYNSAKFYVYSDK